MNSATAPQMVQLDREGDVFVLTLCHGDNRWNTTLVEQINRALDEVEHSEGPAALVTASADPKFFSNGLDLDWLASRGEHPGGDRRVFAEVAMALFARVMTLPMPTVCAVNGTVAGGGLHFVVDSDVVVAAENATFIDTHTNVGMVGAIENIGLAKRLPLGTALRMTLQGKSFRLPAARAYALGLVDELTPAGGALDGAMTIAQEISKNSPNANSLSMRAVWSATEMPYTQAVEYGYALLRMHWLHPDFKEGPRAFAEKREPQWATE